jgi:hypothetical protein
VSNEVRKMSRLYCWLESDTRQTTLTARANQSLRVVVNYGSKDDSRKALVLTVNYSKESLTPTVDIDKGEDIR